MTSPIWQIVLGCILVLCSLPAYAYIDPGTGSALIQGLIAAVAAIGVTLKLYWHRIMNFIGKKDDKHSEPSTDDDSDGP